MARSEKKNSSSITSRHRVLGYLPGLFLTVGLLYLVFQGTNFATIWGHMRSASIPALLLASIVQLASIPARVGRWQTLLRPVSPRLSFPLMLEVTFVGYLVSSAIPGRVGEVVRPGLLSTRSSVAPGTALGSIIAERLLDVLSVIAVLAVGLATAPVAGDVERFEPMIRRAGVVSGLAALAMLVFLLALVANRHLLERFAERSGRRVAWLVRSAASVAEGSRALRSPRLATRLALESTATWALVLAGFWIGLGAVDVELPFAATCLLLPLVVLGVALPTPAGAGGYHAAISFGLSGLFGVEPAHAASVAVLMHLIAVLPILGVGSALLLTGRFTLHDAVAIGRGLRRLGSPEPVPEP